MRTKCLLLFALFIAVKSFAQCPLEANFALNPAIGCALPHAVFFTDQSTLPDTWHWDFGDGNSSTVQNPVHNYTATGDFTVRLIISDTIWGCWDTAFHTVNVSVPTADFSGAALFGCGPHSVDFTDLSTGMLESWEWDFGDGNTSPEQNPTHIYQTPGVYSVELTVTDINGCNRTRNRPFYVQVIGPNVNFGPHVYTTIHKTINFTDSTIFGAPIVAWGWDFGDGLTSNLQNPTHTYDEGGNYTVSLTVYDIDGCNREKIQDQIIIIDTTMIPVAVESSVCEGTAALIKFPHSINGLNYYLSNNNGMVDGPLAGNGDTLTFSTGGVLSNTNYFVHLEDQNAFTYEFATQVLISTMATSSSSVVQVACGSYFFNEEDRTQNGIYFDTLVNAIGCDSIIELALEISPEIILESEVDNITCAGSEDGLAAITASGGIVAGNYNYQWNDPQMQTTATATNLPPGNYQLVVTDDHNCSATIAVSIEEPNPIELSGSTQDATCANSQDGSATVIATGGTTTGEYQYSWNDPMGQSSATAQGLAGGTYIVIVVDDNDCAEEIMLTIKEPIPLVATTSSTDESAVNANDGTATVFASGGTAGYTYLWNDPNGQTTATATDLSPGNYAVTVTDANGCVEIIEVSINPFDCAGFELAVNSSVVSCNGGADGTITIDPVGGNTPFSISWNTGQDDLTIDDLSAGEYIATIRDNNGCILIEEIVIEEPTAISLSKTFTDESAVDANDGTATVIASGGVADYTYLWNDPQGQNTATATNLAPGNYVVTVTDANGCVEITEVRINAFSCAGFELSEEVVMIACHGEANGEIIIDPLGGNAPYEILWNTGQTEWSINSLLAGQYTATITDNKGCILTKEIVIEEPTIIELSGSSTDETAVGNNDGTANINASGGAGNFTYLWDDPQGQTSPMATGLAPGIYTVTVTDANTCTATFSVTINAYDCGGFDILTSSTSVTCFGGSDGSASVDPPDANGPYTFAWNNGQTGAGIDGLSAGNYSVTVTDVVGCTATESIMVEQAPELMINMLGFDGACDGLASISTNVTGGVPPYTYLWNNNETSPNIYGLEAGIYSLVVTDANACKQEGEVQVEVNPGGINAEAAIENVTCFGQGDGAINLNVSGQGPFTYEWNNGAVTEDIDQLSPGNYSVFVTDGEGCNYLLTYVVSSPAALSVDFEVTSPSTSTSNDGEAVALVSGGISPYSYLWSNGSTSIINQGLSIGTYQVTITDANDCVMVAEVPISLSTAVQELENLNHFEIFPNPTNGIANVSAAFATPEDLQLTIYDVLGQPIYQKNTYDSEINLKVDLSTYDSGFYLIQIRTNTGQKTKHLLFVK